MSLWLVCPLPNQPPPFLETRHFVLSPSCQIRGQRNYQWKSFGKIIFDNLSLPVNIEIMGIPLETSLFKTNILQWSSLLQGINMQCLPCAQVFKRYICFPPHTHFTNTAPHARDCANQPTHTFCGCKQTIRLYHLFQWTLNTLPSRVTPHFIYQLSDTIAK